MYAIVDDITPSRATVLLVGTASEVHTAWYELDLRPAGEPAIVAADGLTVGDRIWLDACPAVQVDDLIGRR